MSEIDDDEFPTNAVRLTDEVDPLDAYMEGINAQVVTQVATDEQTIRPKGSSSSEESESNEEEEKPPAPKDEASKFDSVQDLIA